MSFKRTKVLRQLNKQQETKKAIFLLFKQVVIVGENFPLSSQVAFRVFDEEYLVLYPVWH